MPELPEVETIAAGLRRKAAGLVLEEVRLFLPKLLRKGTAADLAGLHDMKIVDVGRRGKHLVLSFDGGLTLLFHLKMTGQFLWADPGSERDKHTHLSLRFRGHSRELRFRDVRKFGFVRCLATSALDSCAELAALGPEPLEIGRDAFARRLAGRRGRMKSLLLDQTFLAGIGNIYADEILFRARIHPLTRAEALRPDDARRTWAAVRNILGRAVAAGGSSIRDFKDDDGADGHFQFDHRAYGRKGRPCRRCGTAIRRIIVGGRSSFFCPRCQPRRRGPAPN